MENGTVEHAGVPAYYVQEPPKRFPPRLYERFVRYNLLGLISFCFVKLVDK